jgi:hypothetical protein
VKNQNDQVETLEQQIANLGAAIPSNKPFLPSEPLSPALLHEIYNGPGLTKGWIETYIILPQVLMMVAAKKDNNDSDYQKALTNLRSLRHSDAAGFGRMYTIKVVNGSSVQEQFESQVLPIHLWDHAAYDTNGIFAPYIGSWTFAALQFYNHPQMFRAFGSLGLLSDPNSKTVSDFLLTNKTVDIYNLLTYILDEEDKAFVLPFFRDYTMHVWFNEVNQTYSLSYKEGVQVDEGQ